MTGTVQSSDGTTIAFDRTGEGPAVVLVGGAMHYRALDPSFGQIAERLASRATVYTYDRRGRGESTDTPPYAVEREIEDLEAIIGMAGGTACVMGASSGAVLALRAAAHGVPIPGLVMYEPPFIVDSSRPPLPGDYVQHLDKLMADGNRGEAVRYFMTAAVGMPAEMVGGMGGSPMWPALEAVAHTLAYDGRIMGDTMSGDLGALEVFRSVPTRTLVLDGGLSPEFMRAAARTAAEVLPKAEYRTLDGQTHQVEPAAIAPVLEEFFLASLSSRSGGRRRGVLCGCCDYAAPSLRLFRNALQADLISRFHVPQNVICGCIIELETVNNLWSVGRGFLGGDDSDEYRRGACQCH